MTDAVVGHGGRVHRTEGDAFVALFSDACAGVDAATEGQRALAGHEWPDGVQTLRVRMGLHTGYVQRLGDDYAGLEIHLAARIGAAAKRRADPRQRRDSPSRPRDGPND